MNVLLVDDEDNIRQFLKVVLKSAGFQVVEASSGSEALKLAAKHQIDVLVTDVVMSDIDGRTLARSLVAINPKLPVLFISGYPMNFDPECEQFSRCAFLPKPFPAKILVNTVTGLAESPS